MSPTLRLLDILLSLIGLVILLPLLLALLVVGLADTGSPLFRQQRVGRNQKPFTLIKFRTMKPDTDSVATHLVSAGAITAFGRFLRASKLDELPQLWNVLKGEMSLVGPRPCLPSQSELIEARKALGVFDARPGITGLAQVEGIDMSTPDKLARTDAELVSGLSIISYFYFIFATATGQGAGDRVRDS